MSDPVSPLRFICAVSEGQAQRQCCSENIWKTVNSINTRISSPEWHEAALIVFRGLKQALLSARQCCRNNTNNLSNAATNVYASYTTAYMKVCNLDLGKWVLRHRNKNRMKIRAHRTKTSLHMKRCWCTRRTCELTAAFLQACILAAEQQIQAGWNVQKAASISIFNQKFVQTKFYSIAASEC